MTAGIKVMMQKRDSGYYQLLYTNGIETAAYRFDILFGQRNAQTSLYWDRNQLYELPVSHYNAVNAWGTSPGFPADHPEFRRLIDTDCFDCHSSNITLKKTAVNNDPGYEKSTVIYGIDCERCHGPALNHVNYHRQHPGEKAAAWLVKNSSLTQQQKLDACAVCHSGNDKMKIQSRFEFRMGDTLGYFFMPFGGSKPAADVHGNQYALLLQSKCFNINTMTCGTCHDPHKNASPDLATYSQKCMSCHTSTSRNFCPKYASLGESIKLNCIDCHMPRKPSDAISYQLQQSSIKAPYLLRTHKIAVYADSLQKTGGKKEIHEKL
jgi:predicted CXXCH cytochrome family protein